VKKILIPAFIFIALFFTISGERSNKDDSFSFVFMTDVHIRPEKNAVEGFSKAIKEINRIEPDFVISGGDQIDDALEQNFERAKLLFDLYSESVKNFKMPIYNILGNHDIFGIYEKSGIKKSHPLFGKKMFVSRLNKKTYSFDHKGWHFIILDSIDFKEDNSYIGHVNSDRIEWLKTHLQKIDKTKPIVIAAHVPFFTIMPQLDKRFKIEKFSINNALEVLELFKDHNLKFVLQGHVHNYEAIYSGGIWFISGGAICGEWWDGPFHGMQEGFVKFTLSGEKFSWEYVDYGWEVHKDKK